MATLTLRERPIRFAQVRIRGQRATSQLLLPIHLFPVGRICFSCSWALLMHGCCFSLALPLHPEGLDSARQRKRRPPMLQTSIRIYKDSASRHPDIMKLQRQRGAWRPQTSNGFNLCQVCRDQRKHLFTRVGLVALKHWEIQSGSPL